MKLDKEDIKFLNEYDNLEFYFQCNLCNYFISKYGCKAEISIVNQYINTYEYRLILDDLVIEFDAEKSFDLLKGEECLKIISFEESQNVNDKKILTYYFDERSKEITVDEFKEKFRFVNEPKTDNLKEVFKDGNGDLTLEYLKNGSSWTKVYLKNSVSGVYTQVCFE